ncbi:MAG: LuxR family transcriptional regulator, partial [Actinomycetota bacterium]
MDVSATEERLEHGRRAADRRAWPEAYRSLAAADAAGALDGEDLELLAKSAWWTGHPNASIEARERAYARYMERGDRARAAFMALTLRRENLVKLAGSVAQGWLTRAERLLADEPESASHGYLELARGAGPWHQGELEKGLTFMQRGEE